VIPNARRFCIGGSPNSTAPSADASTTLTAIPIGADDRSSLGRRAEFEPDLRQYLGGGEWAWCLHGFLDNGEQLPLQRTMMARGARLQTLDNVIRSILDRKVDCCPPREKLSR